MTESRPFRAFHALFCLIVLFGLLVVLGFVLGRRAGITTMMVASVLVYPCAAFLTAFMLRRSASGLVAPGRVAPDQVVWTVTGTLSLCVAMMSLVQPLIDRFPESRPELERIAKEINTLPSGMAWILIAVLAPLGEEIFFRGALLKGIRASWGAIPALAISSIFFGLFHGLAPRIVVTLLIGVWLGALTLRTGGIALSTLAHALNNATVMALMSRDVEGLPLPGAAAGGAGFFVSAFLLFRSRVQGSPPPGPS